MQAGGAWSWLSCCSDRLEQLRFQAAAAVLPHPDKVGKGGEDAFFIADNGLALGEHSSFMMHSKGDLYGACS
jgi:hypothetical protein